MFFKYTKWAMLWALFILILCGIPGRDIPHISFLEILNFDKILHASVFCILILLSIRGFLLQTKYFLLQQYAKVLALLISIIYGGLLEIMQGLLFVERSADIYDFIANSFGCLVGLFIYNWVEKNILKKIIKAQK